MSAEYPTIFARMTPQKLCETLRQYEAAQHDLAAKTDEDRTYWHHFALAQLLDECVERIMATLPKAAVGPHPSEPI